MKKTPPSFLVVAEDDNVIPIENSLLFFQSMIDYENKVSLHLYQKGGHGFLQYPPRDVWMKDLFYWMKMNEF